MSGRNTPTPQIYSMPFCGKSQIIFSVSSFQKDGCCPHARHGRIQAQRSGKIYAFPLFWRLKAQKKTKSQNLVFWRRERDLNPWIHSCITRFRIVRVRPLRHLCNTRLFYNKRRKKATDFAPSREIFCWETNYGYKNFIQFLPILHLKQYRKAHHYFLDIFFRSHSL